MLPVTYASNIQAATQILLEAGNEYSREYLQGAREQLDRMQHYFLVPRFELKPQVYMKVTSNWVQLTLRYVVEPKQRRLASHVIWQNTFTRLREQNDVTIASETSDVAIHWQNGGQSSNGELEQPAEAAPRPNASARHNQHPA